MKQISVPIDTPLFDLVIPLGDRDYEARFDYVQREDRFAFSLSDVASGAPIVSGIKALVNINLLASASAPERPPGSLVLLRLDSGEGPGFRDLGRTCTLIYFEPGELG